MPLTLTPGTLLRERTTLRLGGPALVEAVVSCAAGLDQLAGLLPGLGGRPLALGAGSNLLASDGPHALVLVRAANTSAPQLLPQPDGTTLVRAGAGLRLPRLLGLAQRLGLTGLEGLTGVPGSLGGSVAMNAGSYGLELGSVLSRVRIWTPQGGLMWREAEDCAFGYRSFAPNLGPDAAQDFWLIWEVELALNADAPAAIRERMEAVYARKKASQPVTAKSAGCVFKNPQGASAGKLLDEAGMRGKRLGGMCFSPVHANFLVNMDKGTSAQALELLDLGRMAVRRRFGVDLETEVVVLQ
ncbi:MAG: UDP-N-acetylmuramate dehydrogenase [Proteobacteria bacterium]|nr:UDP-N-acetylmuramate dehydrogenase [Pseudomonadota bacterium]MBU1596775.1 UDP-N-acetylmuramate dehydrogenase [Pseudomonadota bacterium]